MLVTVNLYVAQRRLVRQAKYAHFTVRSDADIFSAQAQVVQAATGGIIQSGSHLTNNGAGLLNLQTVLNETVKGDPLNRVGDNESRL